MCPKGSSMLLPPPKFGNAMEATHIQNEWDSIAHLKHKKFRAASSFFNKAGTKYDSFFCLAKGGLSLHPDSLHHSPTPSTPKRLADSVAVPRLLRPRISPIRFLAR